MITINLYSPDLYDENISFPTTWNDLHPEELYFIAKTLLTQTEENKAETRAKVVKYILERRVKKGKINLKVDTLSLLNPENIVIDMFPLVDFIFNENELTNLPETVTLSMRKYYSQPFEEITCGEFEDCEALSSLFALEPAPEKLSKLAAILLRPKTYFAGNKLTPYMVYRSRDDTYQLYPFEKFARRFLSLPPARLYAILIYYAGCRAQLPKYFPDLYDSGKKNGKPDPTIFTQTIHSGAGAKNGTRNQIRTTKLFEFLFECNQEAKKAKELQAEYDKMK